MELAIDSVVNNMISISKQFKKYFFSISIISIIFITVIANISISFFFSGYLRESRAKNDINVVEYIQELHSQYNGLNNYALMSIIHYALSQDININIRDLDHEILWSSDNSDMMHGMKRKYRNQKSIDTISREYPYMYEDEQIAIIEIERPKSIISSLEDKRFLWTINISLALASVFTLGMALYFSSHLEKKFLNPIYKIKENTKIIEDGKYKDLVKVETNTAELCELSLSVDKLAERLDHQETLRKRMTNDIAHELRTPLSSIKSHLEAFMDGVWEPSIEKLSVIYNETNRLTRLINELSDLSILENDGITLDLKKINISNVIDDILEGFEPMFIGKNIELKKDIQNNIEILGDLDSLNRIFINLLSNSYKYTNENGVIYVTLKEVDSKIKLSIRDNGIGIPKEDLKYVFERFYRSDLSRNRETGGTGIGLTITKALVDAHKGHINIESEVGKGTEVTVEF